MKARIENGCLVISLPLQDPKPSTSGKTLIVATSRGPKRTDVSVNGKPVIVGINAYIYE